MEASQIIQSTSETYISQLQRRIAELEVLTVSLRSSLKYAEASNVRRESVIADLYQQAKGEPIPSNIDTDQAFDRLAELIAEDDDDVWSPTMEYDVSITFTVTVSGLVTARSEEEARRIALEDLPTLCIDDENAVAGADVDGVEFDGMDVSES